MKRGDDTFESEVARGWYPDPLSPADLRYWDGRAWTGAVRCARSTSTHRTRRRTARWGVALVVIVLLGTDLLARRTAHDRPVELAPAESAVARITPAAAEPGPESPTTWSPDAPGSPPPAPATAAVSVPPRTDSPDTSTTPAYDGDFPDPSILVVGPTYWAFATGSAGRNLTMMSSPDLKTWTDPVEALPILPSWASPGSTWAPAVLSGKSGYLLYYTARSAATGRQCISVAFSRNVAGPFLDISTTPMICQSQSGGSIDPSPFVAPDGTRYLLWKSDDNALGAPSRIGVQKLSPDGLAIAGQGIGLLTANAPWQDGVIEGPAMAYLGGRYVLFYGANHWDSTSAGIGYALCDTPTGPCANQSASAPWMGTVPGRQAPSGPSLFTDREGALRLAFHARHNAPDRDLWTVGLRLSGGSPQAT